MDDSASKIYDIKAGIPFYINCALQISWTYGVTDKATFADDIAFLSSHNNFVQATATLEVTLTNVQTRLST